MYTIGEGRASVVSNSGLHPYNSIYVGSTRVGGMGLSGVVPGSVGFLIR